MHRTIPRRLDHLLTAAARVRALPLWRWRRRISASNSGYLRGALSPQPTQRQIDVLAAFVAVGGSVASTAEFAGIRPSTVKRHLPDLRTRTGLSTEQLTYAGRAAGWLVVPSLEG